MKEAKGKLIVLEGPDGSGKATQAGLLTAHLKKQGITTETISFPDYEGNLMGRFIGECVSDKHGAFSTFDPYVASALYAADRFASREKLLGWLREGKTIIADRYVSSNQLHQGSKFEKEVSRRDFLSWLEELEYDFYKLPKPDAVFYLDVPFEISEKLLEDRALASGISADGVEQDKTYLKNARDCGRFLLGEYDSWHRIDCAPEGNLLSREEVGTLVAETFFEVFPR